MSKLAEEKIKEMDDKFVKKDHGVYIVYGFRNEFVNWLLKAFQEIEQARDEEMRKTILSELEKRRNPLLEDLQHPYYAGKEEALANTIKMVKSIKSLSKQ